MRYERIKDSAFYIAIILLGIILIYKLIDEAKLIWIFPLDFTNDWSSHMAKLFFLAKYGFYNLVPNWYNGFILFKLYAPGWFFFTLPIYYVAKNLQLATYISLLIIFVLGFLFINILGRINKFSLTKRIAFFLFFFANPIAIGNFIRVGAIPEMFSWMIFIPVFTLVWYYKEHKVDWKIFFFIFLYSAMIVSYLPTFVVGSIIVLSLFLIKPLKEKLIIVLAGLVSLLVTSFWWVNYLIESRKTVLNNYAFLKNLIAFDRVHLMENIATTIITLGFIIIFYFYWKSKDKSRKELVFFLPILFMAVALLTRIAVIIPYVNRFHPDTYNFFILFITIFLFLKTQEYPKIIAKYAWLILTLFVTASIVISLTFVPPFKEHSERDEELLSLLKYVDGKLLIRGNLGSYGNAYYSYAAVYYNISTPGGWATEENLIGYRERWGQISESFYKGNCKDFIEGLKEFSTTNVISSDEGCKTLKECGFKEIRSNTHVCLYKL